jgi:hypothetical protein
LLLPLRVLQNQLNQPFHQVFLCRNAPYKFFLPKCTIQMSCTRRQPTAAACS